MKITVRVPCALEVSSAFRQAMVRERISTSRGCQLLEVNTVPMPAEIGSDWFRLKRTNSGGKKLHASEIKEKYKSRQFL